MEKKEYHGVELFITCISNILKVAGAFIIFLIYFGNNVSEEILHLIIRF